MEWVRALALLIAAGAFVAAALSPGGAFSDRLDLLTHFTPFWLGGATLGLVLALLGGGGWPAIGLALAAVAICAGLMAPEWLARRGGAPQSVVTTTAISAVMARPMSAVVAMSPFEANTAVLSHVPSNVPNGETQVATEVGVGQLAAQSVIVDPVSTRFGFCSESHSIGKQRHGVGRMPVRRDSMAANGTLDLRDRVGAAWP